MLSVEGLEEGSMRATEIFTMAHPPMPLARAESPAQLSLAAVLVVAGIGLVFSVYEIVAGIDLSSALSVMQ